jgi:hypothetical protein
VHHNLILVTDGIFTDAPMPGNATKAATTLAGLNAAKIYATVFLQLQCLECC